MYLSHLNIADFTINELTRSSTKFNQGRIITIQNAHVPLHESRNEGHLF